MQTDPLTRVQFLEAGRLLAQATGALTVGLIQVRVTQRGGDPTTLGSPAQPSGG